MKVSTSTSAMLSSESLNKRLFRYGFVAFIVVGVIYLWTSYLCTQRLSNYLQNEITYIKGENVTLKFKYPLTNPLIRGKKKMYKIGAIADLDTERSKVPGKKFVWQSYLKTGYLTVHNNGRFEVDFTKTHTLTSNLNEKGRGLELSELCVFNNKLYTADDRTGVIYQIVKNQPIPWVILQDGDGMNKKGFKNEWMTVKNGLLYVGSVGKEYTTRTGKFLNFNPMFVKTVSPTGEVNHLNWTIHYKAIRTSLGLKDPGYVIHEAAAWSDIKQKWFFLPRRMSTLRYDDSLDEKRGTNVLITASADFKVMNVVYVGDLDVTHGFSSFKFIPGTNDDVVVALKTKEVGDEISSYVTIFNVVSGHVIMHEQLLDNNKYEGVEFL